MKYTPGEYIVYFYSNVGSNLKQYTTKACSVMDADRKAEELMKQNEFITSYVVLHIVRNSAATSTKWDVAKPSYLAQA